MHEAQSWSANCFVTLTYGRNQVPEGGSLDHRDFQLFMKRLRKHTASKMLEAGAQDVSSRDAGINPGPIRFYMCGEYGPLNQRPHYHACLFNVDFRSDRVPAGKSASGMDFYDSKELSSLWRLGRVSVQDLTKETAGYCARYIMKKVLGPDSEAAYGGRKPEYAAMSLKPGIGASWFKKYSGDVFPHDYVIADGVKRPVPKYYDRLLHRSVSVMEDSIEYKREIARRAAAPDNTDERRAARETVHKARIRNLSRGDLS